VRFTEINLFGVYGAPMSLMMVVSWVATIGLRWFAARFGLPQYVLPGNAIGAALRLRQGVDARGYDQPYNFCGLRAFSQSTLAIA
jgi:Protein of unknown function (DUF1656)